MSKPKYYLIEIDIDGSGVRWRLAVIKNDDLFDSGKCYHFCEEDFEEDVEVYKELGTPVIGPLSTQQLCLSLEIASNMAAIGGQFEQKVPGEAVVPAATWNTVLDAKRRAMALKLPSLRNE